MNKIKQVAEILGVELGEEFKLAGPYENLTYKLTKDGGLFYRDSYKTKKWEESFILQDLLIGELEILKPILDKQEKQYLENVIRPFKGRTSFIVKRSGLGSEWIVICVGGNNICLPNFKKGTMYKGMESDKRYLLKELELFKDGK